MTRTAKAQKLQSKMLLFQIFQDASSSKSSKSTSQNLAFPNLPRCLKQQKLKTYLPKWSLSKSSKMPQTSKAQNLHPKMVPFQIFQDVSNSASAKPLSQNGAFPHLPRCLKQHKRKTYIPKYCLSKSSNMPQAAKAQNLHPKMMRFQIFQDASNSKSSKPTSQNDAFSNLPRCLKQQKLKTYVPNCGLFKSSKMPKTAAAQNLHPKMLPLQTFQDASNSKSSKPTSQNAAFPNLPRCLKQQNLKTYIPKCCLSKASNISKVQRKKQQTLKTYISKCCLSKSSKMPKTAKAQNLPPKMMPFQIFQDASNSKSAQTYIPKCCFFKSFKMPQTAKAQTLHPKMMPFKFSEMPKTTKAQNLYPKTVPFQIFQDASNGKSSKTYLPKCCLSKSSKMPQTAKAQNLHPKNVAFPNLPRCLKQQKLKTYIPKCCLPKSSNMPQAARTQNQHPKRLPLQIFQDASNSKSSTPISQHIAFPNLPRCLK